MKSRNRKVKRYPTVSRMDLEAGRGGRKMHGVAVVRFHLWANLKAVCRLDVGMRSWNRLLGRLRNELEPTPQQRAAKQLSSAAGWLAACLAITPALIGGLSYPVLSRCLRTALLCFSPGKRKEGGHGGWRRPSVRDRRREVGWKRKVDGQSREEKTRTERRKSVVSYERKRGETLVVLVNERLR